MFLLTEDYGVKFSMNKQERRELRKMNNCNG